MNCSELTAQLKALMAERILVLDGAMGTMIQARGLADEDYGGERFKDHSSSLKGDNDLLSLTAPDVVKDIHSAFFEAGADIISTNTFCATATGQADYGLSELARSARPQRLFRSHPKCPSQLSGASALTRSNKHMSMQCSVCVRVMSTYYWSKRYSTP